MLHSDKRTIVVALSSFLGPYSMVRPYIELCLNRELTEVEWTWVRVTCLGHKLETV